MVRHLGFVAVRALGQCGCGEEIVRPPAILPRFRVSSFWIRHSLSSSLSSSATLQGGMCRAKARRYFPSIHIAARDRPLLRARQSYPACFQPVGRPRSTIASRRFPDINLPSTKQKMNLVAAGRAFATCQIQIARTNRAQAPAFATANHLYGQREYHLFRGHVCHFNSVPGIKANLQLCRGNFDFLSLAIVCIGR